MTTIQFPEYSGLRCLMMPFIQGNPSSVPNDYHPYADILASLALERGQIGYLTIDESPVIKGTPHRGARAKHDRALHTEAGIVHGLFAWGGSEGGTTTWGGKRAVTLDRGVRILLANNIDRTCAIWEAEHEDTSEDGDIGYDADRYPYEEARLLREGEVANIGILTPHESLPVPCDMRRQFLRIVGAGVYGRESYFTINPLVAALESR